MKSVPIGVPPIVSFRPRHPHEMPLLQSDPWDDSLKHVALLVFSFIPHCPVQLFSHDGSVLGKACFADRAPSAVIGPAQSRVASPVEENLFKHPFETQPYHRVDQPVPDAPLG